MEIMFEEESIYLITTHSLSAFPFPYSYKTLTYLIKSTDNATAYKEKPESWRSSQYCSP
jgi:hypothetical protein